VEYLFWRRREKKEIFFAIGLLTRLRLDVEEDFSKVLSVEGTDSGIYMYLVLGGIELGA
jgi:hypothetical protein